MIVRKSYQPFPELTDIPLREQSETSGGHWHKHKREEKKHPTSHQSPPALKKLKVATVSMSMW